MTPEAWFAAVTPEPLLVYLRPDADDVLPVLTRRFRLFACACARMAWDLLPTDARSAVQIAERFADGRATATDLGAAAVRQDIAPVTAAQSAVAAAAAACADGTRPPVAWGPHHLLLAHSHAAPCAARALATRAAGIFLPDPRFPTRPVHDRAWDAVFAAARATQAAYVRDIFPPPDYTPHLDPDWPTSTAVALARGMDESGDFSQTPILADALQDAGCEDPAVLQCLRAPGDAHVRGNWVVDLVLGRE